MKLVERVQSVPLLYACSDADVAFRNTVQSACNSTTYSNIRDIAMERPVIIRLVALLYSPLMTITSYNNEVLMAHQHCYKWVLLYIKSWPVNMID